MAPIKADQQRRKTKIVRLPPKRGQIKVKVVKQIVCSLVNLLSKAKKIKGATVTSSSVAPETTGHASGDEDEDEDENE